MNSATRVEIMRWEDGRPREIREIKSGRYAFVSWKEWKKMSKLYDITVAYNALWRQPNETR
ncbi:hypothetical protein LCGC14_0344730 [marine sediment metagenome]|uniref:Uncharacterized protein n=1 Tax=marine sediment metagenome TaxID=412755 RepID=A0A0F9TVL0_9ZZZZ